MSGWRIPPLLWIQTKLFPTFVWRLNFVLKLSWLPWFPIRNDCPSVDECKHISCRCLSLSCFDGWLCQGRGVTCPPPCSCRSINIRPRVQIDRFHLQLRARAAANARSPLNDRLRTFVWAHVIRFPFILCKSHVVIQSERSSCAGATKRPQNHSTGRRAPYGGGSATCSLWLTEEEMINDKTFLTDSIRLINKKWFKKSNKNS